MSSILSREIHPVSPISQLLQTMGMTRDDLTRHSDQMRQFLVADVSGSRRTLVQEPSDADGATTPTHRPLKKRLSSRSFSLHDASAPAQPTPSPATPIVALPVDPPSSSRRYDSMEAVIERQNRTKRGKRPKRERDPSPPSQPRSASRSASRQDSHAHSRVSHRASFSDDLFTPQDTTDEERGRDALPPPLTPTAPVGRHYRDSVLYQSLSKPPPRSGRYVPREDSPSPSRSRRSSAASSYRSISVDPAVRKQELPFPPLPVDASPVTPRKSYYKTQPPSSSQLPPSSPATISPASSPVRPLVNIVSSPGPMGPELDEEDYDALPFKLPPGPYSTKKPDAPYAALIGKAILASPEHRLTLQEIYDFITIVWPHFKRNEQTWMNSIRHVLSTTVVFRKVQRDRTAGRTLWAIFDQDLDCFKDGGFRKEFCADMQDSKSKTASSGTRKRLASDNPQPRKAKRAKKVMQAEASQESVPAMGIPLSALPPGMSFAGLLFHPPHPGTHHQPYYNMAPAPAPGSGLHLHSFPPGFALPPPPPDSSRHHRTDPDDAPVPGPSRSSTSSSMLPDSVTELDTDTENYLLDLDFAEDTEVSPSPSLMPASSSVSSTSLPPPLTPNNSSSSPPLPVEVPPPSKPAKKARPSFDISQFLVSPIEASLDALAPGITLLNTDDEEDSEPLKSVILKGKGQALKTPDKTNGKSKLPTFPRLPESPTLMRQAAKAPSRVVTPPRPATPPRDVITALKAFVTPPARTTTPPRKSSSGHQLSAMRTPLSHLGVHMSPSPSLAHYKSHLNPPPTVLLPTEVGGGAENAKLHTPSRKRMAANSIFTPLTPRKLVYPSTGESPYRTPLGAHMFDPHDPQTVLDEELARMARGSHESPAGMFGAGHLYESPSGGSPGWWGRMW